MAQTPQTDQNWVKNNTFSDEFDGLKKNVWYDFTGGPLWGSQIFRTQNILFGSENDRDFLRFIAEMVNGTPYSGGIWTGYSTYSGSGILGLGYGYYEIEARVIQTSGIVSGLWPAFWIQHENFTYPYWYEEMDIFEPDNCQVRNNNHHVTYWCIKDQTKPQTNNLQGYTGDKYNVNMSMWHKYALEWLPEKVIFYIDDEAFFELPQNIPHPYDQNTCFRIDLQTGNSGQCPPNINNGLLGYFDVNYFRYYQLNMDCNTDVNEIADFDNFYFAVKKSITLSGATIIPQNSKITLRATDYILLQSGFEVPLGAEFCIEPTSCY